MTPSITFPSIDPSQFHLYQLAGLGVIVLLFMAIVFSLLVVRQALQMTHVLPTKLAPWVRSAVIGYCIFTFVAFAFALSVAFL